jgi:hypothetical protein
VVDLNTKLAIIKHLDEGHNIRAIVDKFSVSKGTVQVAKENKDLILNETENNRSLSKTRILKHSDVNVILWRWFAIVHVRGYPIRDQSCKGRPSKLLAN